MDLKTRMKALSCNICEDMVDCDNCNFVKETRDIESVIEEMKAEVSGDANEP